jgi:hypothetical protein
VSVTPPSKLFKIYSDIIRVEMINFKITDNYDGMITVTEPVGGPILQETGGMAKCDSNFRPY